MTRTAPSLSLRIGRAPSSVPNLGSAGEPEVVREVAGAAVMTNVTQRSWTCLHQEYGDKTLWNPNKTISLIQCIRYRRNKDELGLILMYIFKLNNG